MPDHTACADPGAMLLLTAVLLQSEQVTPRPAGYWREISMRQVQVAVDAAELVIGFDRKIKMSGTTANV